MPAKKKTRHLQEPLFNELKSVWCYICGCWITKDAVYVGHNTWRHRRCRPRIDKEDTNVALHVK